MIQLTRAQKQVQKAARDFAKGEFDRETAREAEKIGQFPEEVFQRAAALGFVGIQLPEAYSGGGMGLLEAVLLAETLCALDGSLGQAVCEAGHGAECIARFGSQDQKERFLPPILEGRTAVAVAFVEAGRGISSAPAATAAPDDKGWLLNGTKHFVSNAERAGIFLTLAATPAGADETGAASMFIVDADAAGIRVTDEGRRLGGNLTGGAEVTFDEVRLTPDRLLGKPGRGLAQLEAYYMERRILLAGQALGLAQGALERAVAYVRQRVQFSRKIGAFAVTRHKIADLAARVEAARLTVYQAAAAFDAGQADARTAAIAKLTAAEAAIAAADEAIQLHGGYGYMREYDVERYYREAKALSLTAGAPGDLRDVVGASVIGKLK
ncbi:MAG TPA: acyl-CoA dehydrogenase [Desulfobacteraceae bacterium]|nr:acyl-CoA/acyl-ACP dehydrogenase [Deltaproteobacteria bacterium]HDI60953.1 acyl-CoA dehydrogenase [Desulfobacteraceae bacterium]